MLKEDIGINLKFVGLNDDYSLDIDDLKSKLDDSVKMVSFTQVSNVTGQVFDLKSVDTMLTEVYGEQRPYFIVDSSQGVPHMKVNVAEIGCDFLFFTGHKLGADSGIGVLWGKGEHLLDLKS